jgi:hypothetical protein
MMKRVIYLTKNYNQGKDRLQFVTLKTLISQSAVVPVDFVFLAFCHVSIDIACDQLQQLVAR